MDSPVLVSAEWFEFGMEDDLISWLGTPGMASPPSFVSALHF